MQSTQDNSELLKALKTFERDLAGPASNAAHPAGEKLSAESAWHLRVELPSRRWLLLAGHEVPVG